MPKAYQLINQATGEQLEVPEGTFEVGRSRSAGITIADPSLSRIHARIYNVAEGFWIEDLGSTNGTYVLGNRLSEPAHLPEGEKVQFGNVVFTLAESAPSDTQLDPQPQPPASAPQPTVAEAAPDENGQEQSASGPMPSDPTVTLYRRKTSLVPKQVIQEALDATASSSPPVPSRPLPKKYSLSDSGRIRPDGEKSKSVSVTEMRSPVNPPEPQVPWKLFVIIGTMVGLLLGLIVGFFIARI